MYFFADIVFCESHSDEMVKRQADNLCTDHDRSNIEMQV